VLKYETKVNICAYWQLFHVNNTEFIIREIRRASGIPDPEELAEIRRLAALNQAASSDD
jgi:hypothetical protein